MKYVIYANLLLLAGSSIHASEQQERLHSAIKSCKIADVIEMLEAEQPTKSKKSELLKLVNKEVAKRQQASESLFKSAGDLIAIGKSTFVALVGYKLIQLGRFGSTLLSDQIKIPGFPVIMQQKQVIMLCNAGVGMLKNYAQLQDKKLVDEQKQKIAAKLPAMIPVVSTGLVVVGGCLILKSCKNLADAIQKKDAHDKLKKVRVIESYISQI